MKASPLFALALLQIPAPTLASDAVRACLDRPATQVDISRRDNSRCDTGTGDCRAGHVKQDGH